MEVLKLTDMKEIEQKLKELKLQKRKLLLSGNQTVSIDKEIKDLECQLKSI